jgi:Protein of unknown function (DUF3800)
MDDDANGLDSDFIVYVDESGDHSLSKIDQTYPVFVLAFCVFYKNNYINNVIPAIEELKFKNFGHDVVVLHEREIRMEAGQFSFLARSKKIKDAFFEELNTVVRESNFILISCVIDKFAYQPLSAEAENPYHVALAHCLETLADLLDEKGQSGRRTHLVFEARGKREDAELELEFRRLCSGENGRGQRYPFVIKFASKQINSTGLQLADLVARPIGVNYLRPAQTNRAFEALRPKFFCKGGRRQVGMEFEGYGLKVLPPPKSEKPR